MGDTTNLEYELLDKVCGNRYAAVAQRITPNNKAAGTLIPHTIRRSL